MGGTTEKGASVGTGHTRPHMTETPLNRLAVLGVLAGIGTGLLVAALNRAIVTTERLVYGVDHLKALDPGSQVTPLRLAITLVVVGIITSWSWYLLNQFGRPAVSVPGTMNGTPMPLWETLCSVFLPAWQADSPHLGSPQHSNSTPKRDASSSPQQPGQD